MVYKDKVLHQAKETRKYFVFNSVYIQDVSVFFEGICSKLIANFFTRFYPAYQVLGQINVVMPPTNFHNTFCYFQKKKAKKDPLAGRKAKNDPNAPPLNRIPLPEL